MLWKLEKGFVKDIIDLLPSPSPAYNTVSTIVRILEKKGFVDHHSFGKTHQYYPLVSKVEYSRFSLKKLLGGYFGGSFEELVSFFAKEQDLSVDELEQILKQATQKPDDND